jgi:hypothetical protein
MFALLVENVGEQLQSFVFVGELCVCVYMCVWMHVWTYFLLFYFCGDDLEEVCK